MIVLTFFLWRIKLYSIDICCSGIKHPDNHSRDAHLSGQCQRRTDQQPDHIGQPVSADFLYVYSELCQHLEPGAGLRNRPIHYCLRLRGKDLTIHVTWLIIMWFNTSPNSILYLVEYDFVEYKMSLKYTVYAASIINKTYKTLAFKNK